ncbi:MAG: PEP-CTERM sorting domain-containing protein, partial [Puniceicoccales bacterium]
APGNSIGTLTFDGANTTAALLTMNAGATFSFELDASGGVPDQLHFWNYQSGDLALDNNTISVTLTGEQTDGEYTVSLFQFYSDSGSTITGSGLTSGLNLDLGEGIGSGSLEFNGGTGSIDLTYTVVPEPGMLSLVVAVFGSTLLIRRNRKKAK